MLKMQPEPLNRRFIPANGDDNLCLKNTTQLKNEDVKQ